MTKPTRAGKASRTPKPGAIAPVSIKPTRPYNDPKNPFLLEADLRFVTDEDDDNLLIFEGRKLRVFWIYDDAQFREHDGSATYTAGLACERDTGTFYGIEITDQGKLCTIKQLHGKAALHWFVEHASRDARFTRELGRAIDNPTFEFFPLVPAVAKAKAKRGAKAKPQGRFHEQLHMATALVETVRKLDADPSIENLADACRAVSAVHQELHDPANFKVAANG